MPVTVVGNYLSPYVRKVLVCLDLKGVDYEIDPIVPFFGNDEFTRLNPARRVPVLLDGDLALPESSVICEYLEERYPDVPLLPADVPVRARARALQAFVDGHVGDVVIWNLFNQRVIRRYVWREPADEDRVRRATDEDLPRILDYLEALLPAEGYIFGHISVADIALAGMFRNALLVAYEIDAGRWPRSRAFVSRLLDHPAFARLRPFEMLMLRTPIPQQREALREAGAPVSLTTLGTATPRRGPSAP